MSYTDNLWNSKKEIEWCSVLNKYWDYVKSTHLKVEREFDSLNSDLIKKMNANQWHDFLQSELSPP